MRSWYVLIGGEGKGGSTQIKEISIRLDIIMKARVEENESLIHSSRSEN